MTEAIIVIGLGFGDEGKGSVVDYLTRTHDAKTIVRFNGGAQAAHNVVLSDGREHTFAQFGSGSFVEGVKTHISKHMLLNPLNMLKEAEHLVSLGVTDIWDRVTIDAETPILTPLHVERNQLDERSRGTNRHGSCGQGIGVLASLMHDFEINKENLLYMGDLKYPEVVLDKLYWLGQTLDSVGFSKSSVYMMAETYKMFYDLVDVVMWPRLTALLAQGTTIFEGAQGALLDENFGFHPYTTWSNTTPDHARDLIDQAGFKGKVTTVGVLRSYSTRHGPGPFVTEDTMMSIRETHNVPNEWQGAMRYGWFDIVAARYAIEFCGGIDSLAITCLDQLMYPALACIGYTIDAWTRRRIRPSSVIVSRSPAKSEDMFDTTPLYAFAADEEAFLKRISYELNVPIRIKSYGPTPEDKTTIA